MAKQLFSTAVLLWALFLPLLSVAKDSATAERVGTGDGGGGNLCQGKPIEHYRTYLHQTPAFQKLLAKYLESSLPNYVPLRAMAWVLYQKPWYLVPCPLGKLSGNRTGLPGDTTQAYKQTQTEVFVEKQAFEKQDLDGQATMIVHEMLMGVKFLKNESVETQCRAAKFDPVHPDQKLSAESVAKCVEGVSSFPASAAGPGIPDAQAHTEVRDATTKLMTLFRDGAALLAAQTISNPQFEWAVGDIFGEANLEFGAYTFNETELVGYTGKDIRAFVQKAQVLGKVPGSATARNFFSEGEDRKLKCQVKFLFDAKAETLTLQVIDGKNTRAVTVKNPESGWDYGEREDGAPGGSLLLSGEFAKPYQVGGRRFNLELNLGWDSLESFELYEDIIYDVSGNWPQYQSGPASGFFRCEK